MINKISAHQVNALFEQELWKKMALQCGYCHGNFKYEPFVYTYPDGQQTICCSKECHAGIRRELRAAAKIGGRPNEP